MTLDAERIVLAAAVVIRSFDCYWTIDSPNHLVCIWKDGREITRAASTSDFKAFLTAFFLFVHIYREE